MWSGWGGKNKEHRRYHLLLLWSGVQPLLCTPGDFSHSLLFKLLLCSRSPLSLLLTMLVYLACSRGYSWILGCSDTFLWDQLTLSACCLHMRRVSASDVGRSLEENWCTLLVAKGTGGSKVPIFESHNLLLNSFWWYLSNNWIIKW